MQLIDSNILIYAYDSTDKKKHETAKKILQKAWQKQADYALSVQNISEFFYVATEKTKVLPREEAREIVRNLTSFSYWHIFHLTEATLRLAASISTDSKIHFFDALLAATMKEHNIAEIITENEKDFEKIPGIKIINPFTK